MSQHTEDQIREREFRAAMIERRRPEELASIPGAQFVRGPLLSWCCDAEVQGAIWLHKGIRTGMCGGCFKDATFREVI